MPKYSEKKIPHDLDDVDPSALTPTKKRSWLLPIVLITFMGVTLITISAYVFRAELGIPRLVSDQPSPKPNIEYYRALKQDLAIRRAKLSERYKNAPNSQERESVLTEAQALLNAVLPQMMRCWIGTPWDFNGTASAPGQGKIACGYFVSTTLKDAGFKVNRYRLAQQPSQNILRTFVAKSRTQTRVGLSYNDFLTVLKNLPPGIYIVGLDRHVGFIVHSGTDLRFIHSSGASPRMVVDESQKNAAVLRRSNYRVFGNLTAEKATLRRWLNQEAFQVVR